MVKFLKFIFLKVPIINTNRGPFCIVQKKLIFNKKFFFDPIKRWYSSLFEICVFEGPYSVAIFNFF